MHIGFIGLMKAGKDTASDYLCSRISGCRVLKFADPLYEIQNLAYDHLGWKLPPDGKDRKLLQLLGTEWGRLSIKNDIWVDVFQERFKKSTNPHIFVTDLRFPNELQRLKKLGFYIVYIRAEEEIRINRGAKSQEHPSEAMAREWENKFLLDDVLDYPVIDNSGTLEELYTKLNEFMVKIDPIFQYLEVKSV